MNPGELLTELAERLAAYIAGRLPSASEVRVENLERIFGGASRETYRFVLVYREGADPVSRRLILRRDPPGSLIETERAVEFGAYRAFHGSAVPVPEPLWLEEDPRWLDPSACSWRTSAKQWKYARLASHADPLTRSGLQRAAR